VNYHSKTTSHFRQMFDVKVDCRLLLTAICFGHNFGNDAKFCGWTTKFCNHVGQHLPQN